MYAGICKMPPGIKTIAFSKIGNEYQLAMNFKDYRILIIDVIFFKE